MSSESQVRIVINYIYSELLKQKHRFVCKLLWIGPVVTIVLVLLLMQGRYFIEGTYNWWSTMLLPGTLAMLLAFSVAAEKKHGRHGLFTICVEKEKLWLAQILVCTGMLFLTNLILFCMVTICSIFFGISISILAVLLASIVLTLTFMWQIPVFLWISERTGSFFSIMLCMLCNVGFGLFFAPTRLWRVPFAIPARLMCPILGILPNGLPMDAANPIGDGSVILPGIVITLALYAGFSLLSALAFRRREVR